MIDLIELIGSFSAKIFLVEIKVGGMGEKILVENDPIKSIKSITTGECLTSVRRRTGLVAQLVSSGTRGRIRSFRNRA